jgi:diaminopimelate epimerase
MKINFIKTEGGGNDFVLIDRINNSSEDISWNKFVPGICARKHGVGADGVLVLENHPQCDFTMRIFNPDGSEVEMCGNGARCCAFYYFKKENVDTTKFNTLAGIMQAESGTNKRVKLSLPDPIEIRLDMLIKLDTNELSVSSINTGVPHVIVETERLETIDVNDLGRKIRYNEEFSPKGTNVDFVEATGKSSIEVRTYERGVEEETLACGTGVVASAVIESLKGRVAPPVNVKTRGGEIMKVYFKQSDKEDLISRVYDVKLEGKANIVFEGEIEL